MIVVWVGVDGIIILSTAASSVDGLCLKKGENNISPRRRFKFQMSYILKLRQRDSTFSFLCSMLIGLISETMLVEWISYSGHVRWHCIPVGVTMIYALSFANLRQLKPSEMFRTFCSEVHLSSTWNRPHEGTQCHGSSVCYQDR